MRTLTAPTAPQRNPLKLKHVTSYDVHRFCVEASSIGIRAGQPWPRTIETELGNGQPFTAFEVESNEDGLVSISYRQALGCIDLTVFND